MTAGNKENDMTVTLSKRLLAEDASASVASTPASKKLRVLAPLGEHAASPCYVKPGVAGLASLQHQHVNTVRKRRPDAGSDSGSGLLSPPNSGKRARRPDGKPSSSAPSPDTTKTALEALLTCEGFEKNLDVEAELVYVSAAQPTGAAGTPTALQPDSSGQSADVPPSSTELNTTPAPARSAPPQQDAPCSSREKRRDQDQMRRSGRASSSSHGGRDQVDDLDAPRQMPAAAPVQESLDAVGPHGSHGPITLDLFGDKEWQRLFAVLTISDATAAGQQQAQASAVDRVGSAPHRFAQYLSVPAAAGGSATAPCMHEAPKTPARMEGGVASTAAFSTTLAPARSSFLAGEFSRVQQQQNTPPRRMHHHSGADMSECGTHMGM